MTPTRPSFDTFMSAFCKTLLPDKISSETPTAPMSATMPTGTAMQKAPKRDSQPVVRTRVRKDSDYYRGLNS